MTSTPCSGCCFDPDCDCVKECDERYCARHFEEQQAYWWGLFRSCGDNAVLMTMNGSQLAERMAEARRLK